MVKVNTKNLNQLAARHGREYAELRQWVRRQADDILLLKAQLSPLRETALRVERKANAHHHWWMEMHARLRILEAHIIGGALLVSAHLKKNTEARASALDAVIRELEKYGFSKTKKGRKPKKKVVDTTEP